MRAFRRSFGLGLVLVGCHPDPVPTPPDPTTGPAPASTSVGTTDPVAVGDPDCVSFVERDVVLDRYRTGLAKLEESREGEHHLAGPFEEAMGALRFAADNGILEAQSLYGRTVFGTMFSNQAPQPDERDDYVSAIAFVRVAAKAGDASARGYLPKITEDVPPTSEPPYEGLPADWVHAAFELADRWIECHGLPSPLPAD